MKEVIIYGGAFNPPTVAHQKIAQAAANFGVEHGMELWLLPSGERRDKRIGVGLEKRLAYAHGLLASLSTVATTQVCDIELKQETITQTFDTVVSLTRRYPDIRFTWLFGSDSVNSMPAWKKGEWLRESLSMLVVQRPGYELEKMTENITLLEVDQLQTSSSEVRARYQQGLSIEDLVPASVLPLI